MSIHFGVTEEAFKLKYGERWETNDQAVYGRSEISLVMGKQDNAACQLVIKADEPAAYVIGSEPYFSQKGGISVIRIQAVCTLPITIQHIGVMPEDKGVLCGDVLLRHPVIEQAANLPVSLWIEVADGTCPAGRYSAEIQLYERRLFGGETYLGSVTLAIEVIDTPIPAPCSWRFHLDLWQHTANIARKGEVALWSDEHFELLAPCVESLAQLGQKAVTVFVSDAPWSGQCCFYELRTPANLFEYSMIRATRDDQGRFHYDYTAMQRYIDLCASFGIDREIEVFGLLNIWVDDAAGFGSPCTGFGDALRIRYQDSDGVFRYMEREEHIIDYIKALEQFFERQGCIKRIRIAADEPSDKEAFKQRLARLRAIVPRLAVKMMADHDDFVEEFDQSITDLVPVFNALPHVYPLVKTIQSKGRALWYVCCAPEHPNTFLHSSLMESRAIGWISAFLNLDGFLRWSYSAWPEKPREDFRYLAFPDGDMGLIYPSGNGYPLLSLRWKLLRRGLVEYELLREMSQRNPSLYNELMLELFGTDSPEQYLLSVKDGLASLKSQVTDRGKMPDYVCRLTPGRTFWFKKHLLTMTGV